MPLARDAGVRPYRSPLRENRARRTRRRVIEAATRLFLDRGYGAATVPAVAARARVSVPTVEALFGTKARLLKAAIDLAIAGNDEPVPVLEQPWVDRARRTRSVRGFVSIVGEVLAAAQERSAGLVLAVFEGAPRDAELQALAEQMASQRAATAAWIVDGVRRRAPLRAGCSRADAVDTVWLLMDPVLFTRARRERSWSVQRYRHWVAGAIARLLTSAATPPGGREMRGEERA